MSAEDGALLIKMSYQLSTIILKGIAALFSGSTDSWPHMSSPELVVFFRQYGLEDTFDINFPDRDQYIHSRLDKLNKIGNANVVICDLVSDTFWKTHCFDEERTCCPAKFIKQINALLELDDLQLKRNAAGYMIAPIDRPTSDSN